MLSNLLLKIGSGAQLAASGDGFGDVWCVVGDASRQRGAGRAGRVDFEVFFLTTFDSWSRVHSEHYPRAHTLIILMIVGGIRQAQIYVAGFDRFHAKYRLKTL